MPKQTAQEYVLGHFSSAKCKLVEKRGDAEVWGVFASAYAAFPLEKGATQDEAWENAARYLRLNLESNKQRLIEKYVSGEGGRKR